MSSSAEADSRPRASVIGAIVQGWSRALHAPWVAGAIVAACVALQPHDPFLAGYGYPLFRHDITSWTDAVRSALDAIRSAFLFLALYVDVLMPWPRGAVMASTVSYVLACVAIWSFLAGGIVDRLARGRPVGTAMFSWACGYNLGRLLRLGLMVGLSYWILCLFVEPRLQQAASGVMRRFDVLLALACAVELIADFTAIRLIVEDRRSVSSGLVAAIRFIRRRFFRVLALYAANFAMLATLIAVWPWLWRSPLSSWTADLSLLLFLLARTWTRLALIASEIAFFQGELAHAHYTAAPQPTWPDSPAAEAIANLTHRRNA